ncbi:MAG TPA: hypothetical protein VF594_00140 [Rubricoccaceae bacterium]|jgi:hypothetical protein
MSDLTPETPKPPSRAGFTLDLSSGTAPAKAKRPKGFVPVVQKTINLSTRRSEAPPPGPDASPDPGAASGTSRRYDSRRDGPRHDDARADGPVRGEPPRERETQTGNASPRSNAQHGSARRGGPPPDAGRSGGPRAGGPAPRPSGGTSLADLLDEATLARLRGGA